jgi:predicted nucleic acid-binding protein
MVDILTKRAGYAESLRVLRCCEAKKANGFASAVTVADLMYILRKHIAPDEVREAVQTLLLIIDVADVRKSDIAFAFLSGMKDFEDAVQASCAKRIKADYIVTRNFKDYEKSDVPAVLPDDVLKLL